MNADEIDTLAESVAAKIAQGLLRMPDDLRQALKPAPATGWFTHIGNLMPGTDSPFIQIITRPDGIEIVIRSADGGHLWRGVII